MRSNAKNASELVILSFSLSYAKQNETSTSSSATDQENEEQHQNTIDTLSKRLEETKLRIAQLKDLIEKDILRVAELKLGQQKDSSSDDDDDDDCIDIPTLQSEMCAVQAVVFSLRKIANDDCDDCNDEEEPPFDVDTCECVANTLEEMHSIKFAVNKKK